MKVPETACGYPNHTRITSLYIIKFSTNQTQQHNQQHTLGNIETYYMNFGTIVISTGNIYLLTNHTRINNIQTVTLKPQPDYYHSHHHTQPTAIDIGQQTLSHYLQTSGISIHRHTTLPFLFIINH